MIYKKPKNEIFASDAKDGEIVDFPNIKRGWGVTENLGFIPPMEYFNAAFNRVDKSLAYQLQRGVGEWDKDLEYPIGAIVSLNGVVYVAKSQNTNKNPANEATIWNIVATQKWSEEKFALKDDLPPLATEAKSGIVKLKNSITAKQEDAAVTEKAVSEIKEQIICVGQTLQDLTSEKRVDEIYENTTGRPIYVLICGSTNYHSAPAIVLVNNIQIGYLLPHAGVSNVGQVSFFVPAGSFYRVKTDGAEGTTISK